MTLEAVYAHPNHTDYVAVDEDGTFWSWPAVVDGWHRRVRCSEALAESCVEHDSFHARLALRLSGAPT